MTTTQRVRRTGMRALVTGTAVFLVTAAPAAAWAAPSQTAGDRAAATPRAETAITCNELDADIPNVFARDCDSRQWGPIADFTVTNRFTGEKYQCRTGWSEGSLWLSGKDCVGIND
ncbi:hypothetical protein [Streptacidiphilus sp. P02-A3a]|uniref:hypothetical protein n=1 Tax=Streptacidiphilus sp. P02-A3a TaxID=2704468 RepID=UPI0015FAB995|nr:hypothetical protein [Streptacidiphilus sp. P02-A3a]QMU73221.1 hypothetical protein GXP74_38310 [Streptacidiphilus sp. P02-A3a]